MLIGWAIEGY
uniref:Uncharacterized protein n=1 Tax=Lepeophtheirus salmonis TaxID=72036 RepID=A0A0K2UVE2_LEPSM